MINVRSARVSCRAPLVCTRSTWQPPLLVGAGRSRAWGALFGIPVAGADQSWIVAGHSCAASGLPEQPYADTASRPRPPTPQRLSHRPASPRQWRNCTRPNLAPGDLPDAGAGETTAAVGATTWQHRHFAQLAEKFDSSPCLLLSISPTLSRTPEMVRRSSYSSPRASGGS